GHRTGHGEGTLPGKGCQRPVPLLEGVGQAAGILAGRCGAVDHCPKPGGFSKMINLLGNVPTNFSARRVQLRNGSSSLTPAGAPSTQPFIACPVMSSALACGSFSTSLLPTGPRLAMRESFQTPSSRFPSSRKPRPANIFCTSIPSFGPDVVG